MTQMESLSPRMIRTATIAFGRIAISSTGEVLEDDLRDAGCGLPQLRALAARGIVTRELKDAGQGIKEFFYSVEAE